MPKFMITHRKDPQFVSYHINIGCKICAKEKRAVWKRVYYNVQEGRLFCEWEASDRDTIERILKDKNLPCEEIVEVKEMIPEECFWEVFGEIDE
ncbi:MAG: DUF4242 domain-containing protein [Thermodesulfobacteriota bacterium]|nr:DUF4242 domain-containing protein [Thermodesulfobacteriota bacterium]